MNWQTKNDLKMLILCLTYSCLGVVLVLGIRVCVGMCR
jgi:hypothetical protein